MNKKTRKPDTRRKQTKLSPNELEVIRVVIAAYGRKSIVEKMEGIKGFSIGQVNLVCQGERDWSKDSAMILEKITGIPAKIIRPDLF